MLNLLPREESDGRRSTKKNRESYYPQMSPVWQPQNSARLQTHAVVHPYVWHTVPFVRSLQLVIHRFRHLAVFPTIQAPSVGTLSQTKSSFVFQALLEVLL